MMAWLTVKGMGHDACSFCSIIRLNIIHAWLQTAWKHLTNDGYGTVLNSSIDVCMPVLRSTFDGNEATVLTNKPRIDLHITDMQVSPSGQ
jgi:hypothetical protein